MRQRSGRAWLAVVPIFVFGCGSSTGSNGADENHDGAYGEGGTGGLAGRDSARPEAPGGAGGAGGGPDAESRDATVAESGTADGRGDGAPAEAPRGDGVAGDPPMSFFVTSRGRNNGGNLGGLMGADDHCRILVDAAGITGKTWRAYLSTSAINARDRIGAGPWFNARGQLVAQSLQQLHPTAPPLVGGQYNQQYVMLRPAPALILDERGNAVPGSEHDILTGSNGQGNTSTSTCQDWTSNANTQRATVGHSDLGTSSPSWNSAHTSLCTQQGLIANSGTGRFYCFATD